MIEKIRRLGRLSVLLAVPMVAAGCSDDDTTTNPPTSPSNPGVAQVRVAHLSPDAPPVDVRVNGSVAVSGAAYMDVTNYLPVPAGSVQIQVTPAGAATPVVIEATVPLGAGTFYTIAATGLLAAGDLQPIVLIDNQATTGQARVRFVHASPDAPAVDVALADGGPVLFGGVPFRGAADYIGVDGGTYDLEVRVAGTSAVALPLPGFGVNGGTNYTVFAIGQAGNGTLEALPLIDAN
jgi:Domain of unknown function (DUF4397)